MNFLRQWRVWMLLVFVIASVLAMGMKDYPYGRSGVKIAYVLSESPANGILVQGMTITEINGQEIDDLQEWKTLSNTTGDVKLKADGKQYNLQVNGTLGIEAVEIERTNLELGLDLQGGTRIVLRPVENATAESVQQIISVLETRANFYGLREIHFYPVSAVNDHYIEIEAAGVGSNVVEGLLSRQGTFEAWVNKSATLSDGRGSIKINGQSYPVEVEENQTILVEGKAVLPGGKFSLESIDFIYTGGSGDTLEFIAKVFDNDDIELIYTDSQRSGILPQGSIYFFHFSVLVSSEGAERFASLTRDMDTYLDLVNGEEYLKGSILLYLDGEEVSSLNIGASLRGQLINSPSIQGSRETKEEATEEMLRLQTVLRSGALPVKLETVSVDVISPRLGSGFFVSAAYAGALAAGIVVVIVFVRYRNLKIALPMAVISLSEVLIVMGIAATEDMRVWAGAFIINLVIVGLAFWKKEQIDISGAMGAFIIPIIGLLSWSIDLAAIAGIIAAIGTGVDQQIIIADETLRGGKGKKKIYSIKEEIKRAFFIVFGAAATIIATMLPLLVLGIGMIRGFAITTIVGVLVGVLVTRPAYAKIIENLLGE